MGTLRDQPARQDTLLRYAITIGKVGREIFHDGCNGELTETQWHVACDVTRTALAIQNADVRDEQLADLGKLLESLSDALIDRLSVEALLKEAD